MKMESDKTKSKKLIIASLEKMCDLSILRLGNRLTKKSKKGKVQNYVSVFETNAFQIDYKRNA